MKKIIQVVAVVLFFGIGISNKVWGQINENFNGAALPTGWASVGSPLWNAQQCEGAGALGFNGMGDGAITPAITNPNKLNFDKKRSSNTDSWSMLVEISGASPASQTSGPWTTVATITSISSTCGANPEIDLSAYSGLRYVRFIDDRASGSSQRAIDNVSITVASTGTSTITAGPTSEPATISSLTNTQGAAAVNFDIDIKDDGATAGTDALDTKITQMVFTQGTGNDVSTWTTVIEGAELSDGTNTMTGTVNASNITFSGINPATLGLVTDNSTKTYSLKVWLKTDMGSEKTTIDGKNLVFRIQQSNITIDNTGSGFASGQDQNSGASNNAVSVVASKLAFVQNATNVNKNVAMSPTPTVSADDANGNRDLDFVTSVSITSTGTLQGSPVSATPTSGLASFSSLIHTVVQTGRQLTASSSGLTDASSASFDVLDASSATDHFRSNGTGSWATPGTWQSSPDGNNPWITATLAPTSSAATITVRSGNTVTVGASVTVDQVTVEANAQITVSSGFTFTIANGTGTDFLVEGTVLNSGTVTLQGATSTTVNGIFTNNSSLGLGTVNTSITVNGTFNQGSSGTVTNSNSGTITFSASGIYNHNRNGGTIPTTTWNIASNCNVNGITSTAPTGLGQAFGKFTWNCGSQSVRYSPMIGQF